MKMSRGFSQIMTTVTKSDHMNYILQISEVKRKFTLDKINLSARRGNRLYNTIHSTTSYILPNGQSFTERSNIKPLITVV